MLPEDAVDERFQAILDNLPPKPPRSRLEPYWELIRELRRRGRTYRDISQLLAEKFEIAVAPSTVHDFVRVRTQRPQPPQQSELTVGEARGSETAPGSVKADARGLKPEVKVQLSDRAPHAGRKRKPRALKAKSAGGSRSFKKSNQEE